MSRKQFCEVAFIVHRCKISRIRSHHFKPDIKMHMYSIISITLLSLFILTDTGLTQASALTQARNKVTNDLRFINQSAPMTSYHKSSSGFQPVQIVAPQKGRFSSREQTLESLKQQNVGNSNHGSVSNALTNQVIATSNKRQQQPHYIKDSDSVERNNHESSAQTNLGSFFKFMARNTNASAWQTGQAINHHQPVNVAPAQNNNPYNNISINRTINNKQQSGSSTIPTFQQFADSDAAGHLGQLFSPLNQQQITFSTTDDNQRALMNGGRTQVPTSEFDVPLIVASGNPSHYQSESATMDQMGDSNKARGNQIDHIENSFYATNFDSLNGQPQVRAASQNMDDSRSTLDVSGKLGSSHDRPSLHQNLQRTQDHPLKSKRHNRQFDQDAQPVVYRNLDQTDQQQYVDIPIRRPDLQDYEALSRPSEPRTEHPSPNQLLSDKKKMLTNAQLMSLIDELKEFNNREANKINNSVQKIGRVHLSEIVPGASNDDESQVDPANEDTEDEEEDEPTETENSEKANNDADVRSSQDDAKQKPLEGEEPKHELIEEDIKENFVKPKKSTRKSNQTTTKRPALSKESPKISPKELEEEKSLQSREDRPTQEEIQEKRQKQSRRKRKKIQSKKSIKKKDESDDGIKLKPEDIAKFAKFLMSREGANMKFQLGLDRESPDDGDENDDEEKDTLLESEKTDTKTRPSTRSENLEKQNADATTQVDKLIEALVETTKRAPQAKKNKKKKKPKQVLQEGRKKDYIGDIDNDKARRKRDYDALIRHQVAWNASVPQTQSKKKVMRNNVQDENFAKMLIKEELMNDRIEAAEGKSRKKLRKLPKILKDRSHIGKRFSPFDKMDNFEPEAETTKLAETVTENVHEGGQHERYPGKERAWDRDSMQKKLLATRKLKSQMRSRLPIPMNSLVKNALDGNIGLRVQHKPQGQGYILNNNGSTSIHGLSKMRHNEGEFDNDSRLIPTQIEPDKNHALNETISLQSGQPLEEEYPISDRVNDRLNMLSSSLDRYFNDGFLQEAEVGSLMNQDSKPDGENRISQSSEQHVVAKHRPEALKKDHDFDINVGIDGKKDIDDDSLDKESAKERRKTPDTTLAPALSSVKRELSVMDEFDDPVDSETLDTPIGPDKSQSRNTVAVIKNNK